VPFTLCKPAPSCDINPDLASRKPATIARIGPVKNGRLASTTFAWRQAPGRLIQGWKAEAPAHWHEAPSFRLDIFIRPRRLMPIRGYVAISIGRAHREADGISERWRRNERPATRQV
jgi:hypothetical protein